MRTPILLWGDLVKGKKAITRKSLVGESAHECMYAWIYLTEFLAVQRLRLNIKKLQMDIASEKSILADFDTQVWKAIERKTIDPHFQLTKKTLETICILNALVYSWKDSPLSSIVELGQTFFTTIDKFRFIYDLSKNNFDYTVEQLKWIGIDNSDFCNTTAKLLHGGDAENMTIYTDWKEFSKKETSLFHSRFVCSYAFSTTSLLADFICKNTDCALIEDAFSTIHEEKNTNNHGQSEVFFNINLLNQELLRNNFETYILDYYGDWPAGSEPCLVVKMLILKKGCIDQEKFKKFLAYHGYGFDANVSSRQDILGYMMSNISSSDWQKIRKNKKIYPVWGRTDSSNNSSLKNLLRYVRDKIKIFSNGYGSYTLHGQNAEREIVKHIHEKHSR